MTEHASHQDVSRWARAGGAVDDVRPGCSGQLLKLHSLFDHAREPGLMLVTMAYRRPPEGREPGTFAVYADVHWVTGKGQASARIDVPAGGTCVTVAGADGLEVSVGAEGTREDVAVRVEGMASWVQSAHPRPAQRTVTIAPAALGIAAALPAFARRGVLLGPGGLQLQYYAALNGPPLGEPLSPGVLQPFVVPAGAEAFSVLAGAGPVPAADVFCVWELAL